MADPAVLVTYKHSSLLQCIRELDSRAQGKLKGKFTFHSFQQSTELFFPRIVKKTPNP